MALRTRSANRELMRQMNEALVLGIIHDHGPIARTGIAGLSGLSLATISNITGSLINQGIVIEQNSVESVRGRRPVPLVVDWQSGVVIGVKLTQEQIIVALTNLRADLIELRSVPLGADLQPDVVIATLATVVKELRAVHSDRQFIGLGLGMAGIVDRAQGICRYSPFLPWRDLPLRDLIQERVGLPVIVENDVNALTLAERWFGAGSASPNFLVITLGRGVGMGMMLNGELYRGGQDGAGEFGHMTIVEHGPVCNCGKRGCVEAFISEPALTRAVREIEGNISLTQAIQRASANDAELKHVFDTAGHLFGLALSAVINLLNPTLVILGGEGIQFLDLLMPRLREALRDHCFAHFYDVVEIVTHPWGDDAWARGAAGLMLDEYFHPTEARVLATTTVSAESYSPKSTSPNRSSRTAIRPV